MKKTNSGKLQLKKISIATLQPQQTKQLQGGRHTTTIISDTCPDRCETFVSGCMSDANCTR